MNNNNKIYANIKSKCAVCGSEVMIDQWGNGHCDNCDWDQNLAAIDFPNEVIAPNKTSLINAIERFKREENIGNPNFYDFIGMLNFYGEVEFTYKNIRYGVFRVNIKNQKKIEFFVIDGEVLQVFDNDIEFAEKANINKVLLKDLWNDVRNANYIQ